MMGEENEKGVGFFATCEIECSFFEFKLFKIGKIEIIKNLLSMIGNF